MMYTGILFSDLLICSSLCRGSDALFSSKVRVAREFSDFLLNKELTQVGLLRSAKEMISTLNFNLTIKNRFESTLQTVESVNTFSRLQHLQSEISTLVQTHFYPIHKLLNSHLY